MNKSNCPVTPFIRNVFKKKNPEFLGVCYQCNFNTKEYSDKNVKFLLGVNLHKSIDLAVTQRKSEFVAGRFLARKALIELGAKKTTVKIGTNRMPLWPDSYIGSISHTKSSAVCAVAKRGDIKRIGIDIENHFNEKTSKDIVSNVLIKSEYKFIGSYYEPIPIVLTLIFSAKESLFKSLYPEVEFYFDFNAVHTKKINFQTGELTLELKQDLSPTLTSGTCFDVFFEIGPSQVFTIIT